MKWGGRCNVEHRKNAEHSLDGGGLVLCAVGKLRVPVLVAVFAFVRYYQCFVHFSFLFQPWRGGIGTEAFVQFRVVKCGWHNDGFYWRR